MSLAFRILLIVFAVAALYSVIAKITRKKLLISDAVFWLCFVLLLVVLALFPQIVFFFSDLLGVESPSHLVFLGIVAILIAKQFDSCVQISTLKHQVADLTEELAIEQHVNDTER